VCTAKDGNAEAPEGRRTARNVGRPGLDRKGERPAREARTEGPLRREGRPQGRPERKSTGRRSCSPQGGWVRRNGNWRKRHPQGGCDRRNRLLLEGRPQGRPEGEATAIRRGMMTRATPPGSWPFGVGAPDEMAGQPQGTRWTEGSRSHLEQAPGSTEAQAHRLPGAFPRPGCGLASPGSPRGGPRRTGIGSRPSRPPADLTTTLHRHPGLSYTPNWNVF